MAKNKKKGGKQPHVGAGDDEHPAEQTPSLAPSHPSPSTSNPTSNPTSNSASTLTSSKSKPAHASAPVPVAHPSSASPALIICRNKHWRYISSFHGPWLQLPPEILETLAHINYNTPLPHPIDPAVFYDLLKIRRLVDDATDSAVRAASGLVSMKSLDNSHHANALGLSIGPANQPKLSAERKHKLREQATARLARAYRLDEIACSVATMQSASSLEDVASLVLKRDPNNLDAKYVHFFHEKIPSRQLAESTSLDVLDDIISRQPSECEALRTRATVSVFKEDYKGAARDLTSALSVLKIHSRHNKPAESSSTDLQLATKGSRRVDVKPDEDQQPSSLEAQLLFARAGVYLSIACLNVSKSLEPLPSAVVSEAQGPGPSRRCADGEEQGEEDGTETETGASAPVADAPPSMLNAEEQAATALLLEARKVVKTNAKKALRDYMAFLSYYHYSPNFHADVADDFTRRVRSAKNKGRAAGIRNESPSGDWEHKVYNLSELFTAIPPTDVPPYPPADITMATPAPESSIYMGSTMEMVTYHPLLADALHALLLSHVLVQTSTKELQRHAHMVARIARLADGYPIFQASRSPARADWIEVLRQGNNWIGLASSWETLCSPTSLYQPTANGAGATKNGGGQKALPAPKGAEMDKEAIHQEALRRAFIDDRVGDEDMFRVAYQAHKKHVEADMKAQQDRLNGTGQNSALVPISDEGAASSSTGVSCRPKPAAIDTSTPLTPSSGDPVSPGTAHRRWAMDEGREYPILTERASAVARWQREAPPGAGASGPAKKKKKPIGRGRPPAAV
ncbi:unnamed protein product [Discula destructiva]